MREYQVTVREIDTEEEFSQFRDEVALKNGWHPNEFKFTQFYGYVNPMTFQNYVIGIISVDNSFPAFCAIKREILKKIP